MDLGQLALIIGKAVGALSFLGLVAAAMLGTAAIKFFVAIDPRVQAVLDVLPGANCGACGNPSCFAVAEGIAEGRLAVTACTAGGQKAADGAAAVMGIDAGAVASVVSCRMCGGGNKAVRAFDYGGAQSCASVNKLAGGSLVCPYGCLGYGDCVRACPFDAMALDERGLPLIDLDKCTGCGICVPECPRGSLDLLKLIPEQGHIAVRCSSHDKGKARRDYCEMTCIICKKCEKICPIDAIHVIDNLAVVDYDKCDGCMLCVEVCPPKCIDVTGRSEGFAAKLTDGTADTFEGFSTRVPSDASGAEEPAKQEAVEA